MMNEICRLLSYLVNDLVTISESMENLREKLLIWKEAFENKGLKVNLKKA